MWKGRAGKNSGQSNDCKEARVAGEQGAPKVKLGEGRGSWEETQLHFRTMLCLKLKPHCETRTPREPEIRSHGKMSCSHLG